MAYAVVGGSMAPKHHHASMRVLAETGGHSRFVRTIDVTPDELAGSVAEMAEEGARVTRETLHTARAPAIR